MKEIARKSVVVVCATIVVVLVGWSIAYLSTPKCYDIRVHAERSGEQLDITYQVQVKKEIDPALRRVQMLVPKEFDITEVQTLPEGRGWFCQQ